MILKGQQVESEQGDISFTINKNETFEEDGKEGIYTQKYIHLHTYCCVFV